MKSKFNNGVFISLIILLLFLVFLLTYLERSVNEIERFSINHTESDIEDEIQDVLTTTNSILTDISDTHLNF